MSTTRSRATADGKRRETAGSEKESIIQVRIHDNHEDLPTVANALHKRMDDGDDRPPTYEVATSIMQYVTLCRNHNLSHDQPSYTCRRQEVCLADEPKQPEAASPDTPTKKRSWSLWGSSKPADDEGNGAMAAAPADGDESTQGAAARDNTQHV